MSQKSSVPQAAKFVSQALKRDKLDLASALPRLWQVSATPTMSLWAMLPIHNSTARKQWGFFAWH
jgi:hypothetical protein